MSSNFWEEVFKLVEQYDAQRPKIFIENRLYYHDDGTIIGYWETQHPISGNYIILEDPNLFFKNNTNLLRVQNGKLILLNTKISNTCRLKKSFAGFSTVKGHAALVLEPTEIYNNIEYYDRTNN
jgi:hypothetical protein